MRHQSPSHSDADVRAYEQSHAEPDDAQPDQIRRDLGTDDEPDGADGEPDGEPNKRVVIVVVVVGLVVVVVVVFVVELVELVELVVVVGRAPHESSNHKRRNIFTNIESDQ